MKRRDFLKVASGAAGGGAAVGAASARSDPGGRTTGVALQQANNTTTGNESAGNESAGNESAGGGGGLPGEGETVTVDVVNYEFQPGTEEPLEIPPGTTVQWVWQSGGHNIEVREQPGDASWSGHESTEEAGFEYEHQFTVEGEYHYVCTPHVGLDMIADIVVSADASLPGEGGDEGGGGGEIDIHEVGVPFQAHFVGIATILMMVVSVVFAFFTLKYGESPHASSPERD